ncbi:MAG: Mov34/MPN/PAD-1 family protein, partial [Promethearchaeota archaeon]
QEVLKKLDEPKFAKRGPSIVKKKQYIMSPAHVPVILTWKAYKRMVGYAIRYANEKLDTKKWREVYGILIGSIEDESKVIVKDAIPMVVGDRAGVKYENKQYVDMAQIDASVYERSVENEKRDFIIGWWHTHPGFGFFFSEIDCYTQLGYQIPNPFAVGLIFDHCEKKFDFLGVAALRLLDPDEGILSDYDTVELNYDNEKEVFNRRIEKVISNIDKNINNVLKELDYIDKTLRKKALAQLQRNFGLILVPKREIRIVEDEEEAEEDEDKLYVWDPDFFKKSYRIPKFREKIESEIQKCEIILKDLLEKKQIKKFEEKKEKFKKKIQNILEKPNDWYNKLIEDFSQCLEKIFPYYDYLDTNERKIIEHFEERATEYFKILDGLNSKAEFNLEENFER